MNKNLTIFLLLFLLGYILEAAEFKAVTTKGSAPLKVEENKNEILFKSTLKTKSDKSISYAWKPVKIEEKVNTVSFELKGDGSDYFASIFLGQSKMLLDSYETVFPLKNTEWHKVEIPFSSFARNVKPWSVKYMDGSSIELKSDSVKYIGFGRGYTIYKPNHPDYSFRVRNINFSYKNYSGNFHLNTSLKNTTKKILQKGKLNILLLGDSITDMGRDLSHAVHAFNTLKKKYDCSFEIVNAAIGGHSVRGGQIILPRSLTKMPKPDLTIIMFGANDCKSYKESNGFTETVFERQLFSLLKLITEKTEGSTEFLLINGVPRVNRKNMQSTGLVEKISGAYAKLNKKHGLMFCNSISAFNQLSYEKKKTFYKDTIHQTQEGLKFIGKLIEEQISNQIR